MTIPVDHGARASISGASFDQAGLIAARPGTAASGADDGVAYFSADGRTWRYAGTIDAAGGWSPDAVKGSDYGFVVTGHTKGQYVAYTGTGAPAPAPAPGGYPAVWRRVSGGPWSLVSTLAQVSADADLNGLSTVTHGPHGWVATGPGGFTLTSADGTNWTRSQG